MIMLTRSSERILNAMRYTGNIIFKQLHDIISNTSTLSRRLFVLHEGNEIMNVSRPSVTEQCFDACFL